MEQDIKDMIYALRDKGNNVTAEEIADAVRFQEQYYDSELEMKNR